MLVCNWATLSWNRIYFFNSWFFSIWYSDIVILDFKMHSCVHANTRARTNSLMSDIHVSHLFDQRSWSWVFSSLSSFHHCNVFHNILCCWPCRTCPNHHLQLFLISHSLIQIILATSCSFVLSFPCTVLLFDAWNSLHLFVL